MLQRLRSRLHGEGGFTLIELLVVILIIGILAAIAIPSFLNQKGKGEDASTKSAARNAQTAMETYYTDQSKYDAKGSDLTTIEPSLSTAGTVAVTAADTAGTTAAAGTSTGGADNYRVTILASNGRSFWVQKKADGTVSRGCLVTDNAKAGGCKSPDSNHIGSW